MWSLYLLANKFLKPDAGNNEGSAENHLKIVETYQIKQSSSKDESYGAIFSCFIEVSLIVIPIAFHFNVIFTWWCWAHVQMHYLKYYLGFRCTYICSFWIIWIIFMILGASYKPTTHVGLWPCLCANGFENSWHLQL